MTLPSWERKFFEPSDQDAFLFYVVYGDIDMSREPLSRSKYRSNGIPENLEIMEYGPSVHPEVVSSFREGYVWERHKEVDADLAKLVETQSKCLVVRGEFKDPENLDYLRDTIGLLTYFLSCGGLAIYDPQTFKWWSVDDWSRTIFETASAQPLEHTVILVSQEKSSEWIHTRGLRKFGRPDISVRNVLPDQKNDIIELCCRLIEFQAYGGVISEGKEIDMKGLPQGMVCHHKGHLDDPDFNNLHIEVMCPDVTK